MTIYGAYFTSLRTAAALVLPLLTSALLYAIFRKTTSPRTRSWSLGLMVLSSIFLWLFIAVSLILCFATWEFWNVYEYGFESGLRTVFGAAVLLSIASGLPLSLLLQRIAPRLVLGKVKPLSVPRKDVAESFNALAREMQVPSAQLRLSQGNIPISFAIQSEQPIVVLSESLLTLLNKDEVEAIMAHELAHVRNSDTTLKAMITAYKTTLPHDPIVRLAEAAFHREREMLADEVAAKVTKRPLSLASALLKIYEAFPRDSFASHGTLSILGAGSNLMSRHPPILQRVNHLIHLAETSVRES